MSTIQEIEAAIEKLPAAQAEALAEWIDSLRARRSTRPLIDEWLNQARGAAKPGTTTQEIMALTRGEE